MQMQFCYPIPTRTNAGAPSHLSLSMQLALVASIFILQSVHVQNTLRTYTCGGHLLQPARLHSLHSYTVAQLL